jgi:hypothetical protein
MTPPEQRIFRATFLLDIVSLSRGYSHVLTIIDSSSDVPVHGEPIILLDIGSTYHNNGFVKRKQGSETDNK